MSTLDPKNPLAYGHDELRLTLPTPELAELGDIEPKAPGFFLRNSALDPQLVWTGKVETDTEPLVVATQPIFVQEKITPEVIVKGLRRRDGDVHLFSTEQDLAFEEKVDFYRHKEAWTNRMILGDSLKVMQSLGEYESLFRKVQMIYMDPPYGIKFGSNWQVSTRRRDVKDGVADSSSREPEVVRAYRDTWEKGIHSYLSYLRDRLTLAHALLANEGSLFVQIGEENVHLVRCLLDEVFGPEHYVSLISFATTTGFDSETLARAGDYLLWYAKDRKQVKVHQLFRPANKATSASYSWIYLPDGTMRSLTAKEKRGEVQLPTGARRYTPGDLKSQGASYEPQPFSFKGKTYQPGENHHWKANYPLGMERLALAGRIHTAKDSIRYVRFADDSDIQPYTNHWTDTSTGNFTDDKVYVVQTATKVVERCMLMTTDPGDLVLDPTCGSGTTALISEQWGRRWITADTSRVALTIARQRLMTSRFPYYLLADSDRGSKTAQSMEVTQLVGPFTEDLRHGFVCEEAPHITLKSIANNEDIKPGLSLEDAQMMVRKNPKREVLYDRPVEDKNRVRVSGPFTVESLQRFNAVPTLTDISEVPLSERTTEDLQNGSFLQKILDHLRTEGIRNPSDKSARISFESVEETGDPLLQALGTYLNDKQQVVRAAIHVGPESAALGMETVREAAKAAIKGLGSDILFLLAFAFAPELSEESKRLGKLAVMPVRLGHELQMSDKLLKKTGTSGLFTLFGDPDVELASTESGYRLTLHGMEVYNPMTRTLSSGLPEMSASENDEDDEGGELDLQGVACWFVDTNYDGEAFHVRQAYFLGAKNPYARLKNALRQEVVESEWEKLHTNVSLPFPMPDTGKVAVKVVNHYGDEVLRVLQVT